MKHKKLKGFLEVGYVKPFYGKYLFKCTTCSANVYIIFRYADFTLHNRECYNCNTDTLQVIEDA